MRTVVNVDENNSKHVHMLLHYWKKWSNYCNSNSSVISHLGPLVVRLSINKSLCLALHAKLQGGQRVYTNAGSDMMFAIASSFA